MKKISLMVLALATTISALAEVTYTPYGFIKASAIYADKALASFNYINLSAPTMAAPRTRDRDELSRTSFQAAQSRFGVVIKKNERLSGRLEFDLIDFAKSSPTTQMYPRVRRAIVTYKGENWSTDIGQDWDLFSPSNPYNYDIIGNYFNAGNSGFQRQQAQFHRYLGEWTLSGALGMAGNNPGVTDNDLEYSNAPTYAVRAERAHDGNKYGVSAIYARLKYPLTTDEHHETWGVSTYFEHETTRFGLKAEAFYGQNLANTGALTLAKGTDTDDVREWGGFLSANVPVSESWMTFGGVGIDNVENKSSITPFGLNASGGIANSGARRNFLSRLGLEHIIETDFSWIVEVSRYETSSKLAANQYRTEVAHSLETGILWKF